MEFFKHFFIPTGTDRIYLDYASSTPLDQVMRRRIPSIDQKILGANPSALHKEGVAVKKVLEEARARAAAVLEAHTDEIIFTASATESDNLALGGAIEALLASGIAPKDIGVCASELEHAAVAETVASYVKRGVRLVPLTAPDGIVDPRGIVVPDECKALIVTVMYVNNEIGTLQPIAEIAKRVRELRKARPELTILFHTDATQAPLYFSLRVSALGVDMMTLGATKLYCQKGVGLLYKKRRGVLAPLLHGGGQEQGLRPGTPPVALIHEFSHALAYAERKRESALQRIQNIQNYFEKNIVKMIPDAIITARSHTRAPHISHLAFPNFDSELLVLELDARGVAVSAKSACKNENADESSVTEAIYGKGFGAIRFSFGRMTTTAELLRAILALQSVIKKYHSHS